MGSSRWFNAIIIAVLLILAGCLEASNTKITNVCCSKVVDGECVALNMTNGSSPDDYSLISGGNCSLKSQVCYNVEIEVLSEGKAGNVTLPMCKYAAQGYCNVSYSFLTYGKYYPNKDANYDPVVQMFMFNNSTVNDEVPLPNKAPIKLLYAKPYLDTLPILDLRTANIYGIKFGVGRSIKQYEQYKNFFPFDFSYSGQPLYNPYFYVLSNKTEDICEFNGNNYECNGREFRTMEACLLFCEMPDFSKPAIWDMRRFDITVNRSLGYQWFYRKIELKDEDWKDIDVSLPGIFLRDVIVKETGLFDLFNRYEVGLFKRFADGPAPNFFGIVNNSSLVVAQRGRSGLFLGEIVRVGSRAWVTLEDGNYTFRVINYSIETRSINANLLKDINYKGAPINEGLDKYYIKNYYSVIELDLNATVKFETCFFVCWTTGVERYNPLRVLFYNNVTEIIAEERVPYAYISHILPYAYYYRFFKNTGIHHKFPRMAVNGTLMNFTGLPYECLAGENFEYCDTTYYARYSCVDKDTGEDIECGCTEDGCYALRPIGGLGFYYLFPTKTIRDPYYDIDYTLPSLLTPTLKFDDSWKVKPSINLTDSNWSGYMEHYSFPSRLVDVPGYGKALAIPRHLSFFYAPGSDLKIMNCFENYSGSDSAVICYSGPEDTDSFFPVPVKYLNVRGSLGSAFCNTVLNDGELFNKSFVRYLSHIEDRAYLFSVAFAVDMDGDNAIGRCKLVQDDTGEWSIEVRTYGLPKLPKSKLTSVAQLITWVPNFNYTGDIKDDVVPAKHACGFPDKDYRTISYNMYRQVKGCYSGTIVNETKVVGPATTEDVDTISNYSYGFWNHLPNTEQSLKNLLIQGIQPILFIDDDVHEEYYFKLLRDINSFIVVDAAMVYPFIQYTDYPIGSVIVVAKDSAQKEAAKQACETCLAVLPIDFDVSPGSASFNGYNPATGQYCNRPRLGIYTCPISGTVDCSSEPWWDQEILFFTTKFTGINSLNDAYQALYHMLEALNKSITYSGKPAYLYIYDVQPIIGTKYLMMAMSNLSTNLSAVGVMGVHFEDFDKYLDEVGSSVYAANELSRALRASNIKGVQEITLNASQCDYVASASPVPLTCINDTYPQMRGPGSNPLEIENLVITSRNFLQNSYRIALANQLSGKYVCNTAPDPETGNTTYYTFIPSVRYFKGTMPVLYHEVYGDKKGFPLQPYVYSKENAKQCAPQDCTFKVKTVCVPTTCYEVKEYHHEPGTITLNIHARDITENGGDPDECVNNPFPISLTGYGRISYGEDTPYVDRTYDGCNYDREYTPFTYGNYSYITTVESNCSGVIDKTLTNNVSLNKVESNYNLEIPQITCDSGVWGWFSTESWCRCDVSKVTVSSSAGVANVRDDTCYYSGGNVYRQVNQRTITFPKKIVTYEKFNETYSGQICYDQVYLDCS